MTTDEIIQSLTMWSTLIDGTSVRLTDDFVSDLQGTLKAAAERLSEVCPVVPDEMVLVPRRPTKEMLEAAWAYELDEDAKGVWESMISAWLST